MLAPGSEISLMVQRYLELIVPRVTCPDVPSTAQRSPQAGASLVLKG